MVKMLSAQLYCIHLMTVTTKKYKITSLSSDFSCNSYRTSWTDNLANNNYASVPSFWLTPSLVPFLVQYPVLDKEKILVINRSKVISSLAGKCYHRNQHNHGPKVLPVQSIIADFLGSFFSFLSRCQWISKCCFIFHFLSFTVELTATETIQ